jgi:hypothetical protein
MHGRFIAGVILLAVLQIGCPHDWMKEGTNDRAMRKDMDENVEDLLQASKPCPEGQSWTEKCDKDATGTFTCEWICQ